MTTLKELTDAAGIQHVVWLDDLFDAKGQRDGPVTEIDLRELVARAVQRGLTVEIAGRTLSPELTTDQWLAQLEEAQEADITLPEVLVALQARLSEGVPPQIPDYSDAAIESILQSFGGEMVTKVGAARWAEVRPTLSDDRRTLLIVDREFSVEGVSTPFGEQVLQDVVRSKMPKVHVVMLTRSVDEDPELLRGDLAARLDIPRQDFEVTAKIVSDEAGLSESRLCASFQRVFTHQVCLSLTRSIRGAMEDNLESAVEALATQSVYDLDRVVFQNSLDEGASELDVLTRILLLRQRVAVDTALAAGADYFDLLSKLRALRQLAGALSHEGHTNSALLEQWRRDEVCDPGERLNPAHSPLTCGDLFMRSGSPEVFILLGQPCDLAVRQTGERHTHEAIFVRAKKWDPAKELEDKRGFIGSAHHFFPIPALPLPGNDYWRLDFRKWASVNLRLLDFSVFSGNGAVRLNVTVDPPVFLLPGWKKLLERARSKISAAAAGIVPAEYASLSLSSQLKQTIASRIGDEVTLTYSRVGRLRAPWAVAAFAAFASYQARAAFDHDFARVLPQGGPH